MRCKYQLLACSIDALGAQGLQVPEEQKRKREKRKIEGWKKKRRMEHALE
jgi:hypothetical protein